ncbi:MAG: Gfo/Idh/MocA family protein [Ilumatobacteraceae bacterium]
MPVRWGFLGAGYVASRAMAPAVHAAVNAQLFGVASRDPQRSVTLEPVEVFDGYQRLLDDPRIDAVYISLTNGQHLEWVTKSLEAGKHVLCEKPLGLGAQEVREMMACAERNNRVLVEAVWSRWHPRFRRIVEAVAAGEVGDVVGIESKFGFASEMSNNYRLDPSMGGGALLDVGCYQVNAWVGITRGARDVSIRTVKRNVGPTKVDLTTEVEAVIDDRVSVHAASSFETNLAQRLVVTGTTGSIATDSGEAFTTWREPSSLRVNGRVENFASIDAFVAMTEAVSDHIDGGPGWVLPLEESLRVAEILDGISAHGT